MTKVRGKASVTYAQGFVVLTVVLWGVGLFVHARMPVAGKLMYSHT